MNDMIVAERKKTIMDKFNRFGEKCQTDDVMETVGFEVFQYVQ